MSEVCPFCNTENIYFSKKRNKYFCEECLQEFELEDTKKSVFFSYGHDKNAIFVKKLKDDLEQKGYTVWIDESEIKVGEDWRNKITTGIMKSNNVLVFLSEHSTRNPGVCLDEIKIALCVKNGNIHTVLVEDEKKVNPPASITNIQWLDATRWYKYYQTPLFDEWYNGILEQIAEIIETNRNDSFEGQISYINNFLKPIYSNSKEQRLLSLDLIDRKWLDLLIEEYRKNSNKKAIIIYGGPGSGKSSYIARLIHYNPYVLASIFCEWDKPIFSETKNIIKTLAFKIASKLQDYREILVNKLAAINESDLNKMDANSLFNYLLTEPLNLLIDGNRETMFIIIDGLDESEELSLVKTLANNLLNLPRWIILLFTSREDYDIKNILENYCLNSINISSNENSHCDIERYLVKELGNLSLNIKKLVEICDGNFLYASLLVKEIKTGFIDIESISTDINSFYALNFRRKFSSLEIYRNYKDILQTILCGNNLPMEILEQIYTYDKVIDFLKIFSSFLVISKHLVIDTTKEYQRISLCHKSLKDFLTNKEKSKEFYLDEKSGYLAIASYFKNLVLNSKLIYEEEDNFLLYYMQNNIVDFYIQSKAYLELEEFLLEPTISLERYFEKIDRAFPEDFDFRKISKRLWEAPDLISFVCEKQKLGNTKLLSYIFKILIAYYDLSNFSYELIKIYIDIVHLSGRYEEAVQISEAYLSQFENKQIYNDKNLLMMKIRTIHHKMFYLPVGELIIEAQAIERNLDCNKYPIEYNELLFLIGGNLGLLFGNQELNEHYLNLSLHWARNNNLENYEIRTIRKIVDMLAINNQHQEALDLLGNYLDFNNLANVKTRYHIYLIGALGEIYRNLGQNAKAMECFEIVKEASENRGIKGWVAHAYLGLAFIMFNQNKEKAKKLAKHALKIYEEIKQVFGMINAKMIILLSEDQDLRSLEAEVEKYNYQYIKKEISSFNHEKYHISFL